MPAPIARKLQRNTKTRVGLSRAERGIASDSDPGSAPTINSRVLFRHDELQRRV